MASDDHEQHLRRRIEELETELEHWRKFAGTLSDLLRRVGSERMSPEDVRVRLQAAVEDRLVVAPVTKRADRTGDDERNRLIADAQRALSRGNLAEAIKVYEALVQRYPEETRFHLKLGDHYARIGNVAKATEMYLAVAAQYAEQGFFLKAVAVYKQILTMSGRLPPEQRPPRKVIADVHYALAGLFEEINLISDAFLQYEEFLRIAEDSDERIPVVREAMARLEAKGSRRTPEPEPPPD